MKLICYSRNNDRVFSVKISDEPQILAARYCHQPGSQVRSHHGARTDARYKDDQKDEFLSSK